MVTATGLPVEMHFAQVWTVRDGRQTRMEMYADPDEALRAVGLGDAGAQRYVAALDSDTESPSREDMGMVERTARGQDAHDVEIGERHDQ